MELPCLECGTPTARDGWCPRCLTAPADPGGVRTAAPPTTLARSGRHTDRSSITFGPVGRTLWTIAIVTPPALVLWVTHLFAGFGFAALWWGVVTPWAMRDLWRTSGRRRQQL